MREIKLIVFGFLLVLASGFGQTFFIDRALALGWRSRLFVDSRRGR